MSIIFEGVDGIGKTTNIRQFQLFNPGFMYIHHWAKATNKVDILSEATKEILLLESDYNILFDRSFIISEYIYTSILGRKTIIDFGYVKELVSLINRKGHTVKLFCFKNKNVLTIKDEDKNLPFEKLNNAYRSLFSILKLNNFILEERG